MIRLSREIDSDRAFIDRNDPNIYRWCRQPIPVSRTHHVKWWERAEIDPSIEMFSIQKEQPPHGIQTQIGVCGLTSIDYVHSKAEFSLYISPENQSKGHGREALTLLLNIGFNNLGLHRIWGEVFEGNHAMKMFLELGFSQEGAFKDSYFIEGGFINSNPIRMLSTQWKTHQL